MRKLAIINPANLAGQELRQEIERRPGLQGELVLLATDDDEVGTLTESFGAAALVRNYEPGDLEGLDLAFLCGRAEQWRPLLQDLPVGLTVIVVSSEAEPGDGRPIVAGVNADAAAVGEVLLSPHPGVVLLAHLLAPLLPLSLTRAVVTLMVPASMQGQEGLDELFEQTRSILTFSSERPQQLFGRQLAFNLYPARPTLDLAGPLGEVLGRSEAHVSVSALQAGIFHGIAASAHLELGEDVDLAALRRAWDRSPYLALVDDEEETPSPVDAAVSEHALVGPIQATGNPGDFWVWAVMDNLTAGTAKNAAELAEVVLSFQAN
jgi:aspartate-semialdehyde dehydrogenase